MDPISAALFALAVTWYGSKSGAVRSLRAVRDGRRERKASRPDPRPSPSGVRLGSAVSAGVTVGGLAVRDFRSGWRDGWAEGRDRARVRRDKKRDGQRSLIDRMLNRMSPADRETWGEARTLTDLGERTARWMEGDLTSQPGYAAGYGPADETQELIPVLADANRHGYVTHGSQPGMTDEHGRQRAGVSGWSDPDTARRIRETCEAEGLVVIDVPPGEGAESMVVSQDRQEDGGWRDFTDFGPMPGGYFHDWWGRVCHRDAVAAVDGAHDVTVIDPEWGRNDRLWPALDRALKAPTTKPPSELEVAPKPPTPVVPVSLIKTRSETPDPPADHQPVPAITLVKETKPMPEIASLPELIMWLNGIQAEATAELEDAQARQKRAADLATQIDHVLANLQSLGLSNEDLNAVGDLLDPAGARLQAAVVDTDAADTMVTAAETAATFITARHAALQEAVNETPQPASMVFYENGKAAA